MPKAIVYGLVILLVLAMIPPALIARQRAVKHKAPPIHFIQDMDNQHKFRAQAENPLFVDHRAARLPVPGTVAVGDVINNDHLTRGVVENTWAVEFPADIPVTMALLERGQERFGIYCQPCHGAGGYGDGIINKRAMEIIERPNSNGTQWVAPKSLHEAAVREQPVGQIFNSITNGVRTMPAYGAQVPVEDRWAIVAYVRALQKSQHAEASELPAGEVPRKPDSPANGGNS